MDLSEFQTLTRKVEEKKKAINKAQGALEEVMKQLKEEFDCDDLPGAKKLLEKQTQGLEKAEREFEKKLKDFQKEWGDKL